MNWVQQQVADPDSSIFDVKIFGERNTATNAMKQIIENNSSSYCSPSTMPELDARAARLNPVLRRLSPKLAEAQIDRVFKNLGADLAWKHCATYFTDIGAFRGKLVLITVRHPGSWLMSLFRNPYHILGKRPANVSDFVDYSWQTVKRERLGGQVFTPLELYCEKLKSYRAFADMLDKDGTTCRYVRFEDLVLDQEAAFAEVRTFLRAATDSFVELSRSAKGASKSLEDYKHYYGAELWRRDLRGLESRINAKVDWPLFEQFGYEPLST